MPRLFLLALPALLLSATPVERVANGLLSPVAARGEDPPKLKVDDRLRFHRVPGFSAAFVEHGQVAWTIVRGPWPGGADPRAVALARDLGRILS